MAPKVWIVFSFLPHVFLKQMELFLKLFNSRSSTDLCEFSSILCLARIKQWLCPPPWGWTPTKVCVVVSILEEAQPHQQRLPQEVLCEQLRRFTSCERRNKHKQKQEGRKNTNRGTFRVFMLMHNLSKYCSPPLHLCKSNFQKMHLSNHQTSLMHTHLSRRARERTRRKLVETQSN